MTKRKLNPDRTSLHARLVESYVHLGRIGVLVELETCDDFTLRTEEVQRLARDLAIHIAAMAPVGIEPVNLGELHPELPGVEAEGDDPTVLMNQPFVRDESVTVRDRIAGVENALSTPIRVRRFVRFAVDDD